MMCWVCLGKLTYNALYCSMWCPSCRHHVYTMEYLEHVSLDKDELRQLLDSAA